MFKRTFRVFFFIFSLICVCITWVWFGWRWGGCALMYCSSLRNFTFCFYLFYFIFACLSKNVLLVFSFTVLNCLFQCLFQSLFVLLFYFVFVPFLYLFIVYVMWLYFINFSLNVYVALKWDYHILFVYWLIVYKCRLYSWKCIVIW
jgi:hypothetical protein